MNRRRFLQVASVAAVVSPDMTNPTNANALTNELTQQQRWVQTAERLKPRLTKRQKLPVTMVRPVADAAAFLRWRMEPLGAADTLREKLMHRGDAAILDFGEHMTGRFSFSVVGEGRGIDAPTRLKITLGEVPAEVAEPFDPYKGGLSRAWLQDEVINLDVLPATVHLPRRYAFRYVKIEVVAVSPNFGVRLHDVSATALTSAGKAPAALPAHIPERLRRIDEVSIHTLRDCMQTVFEDGPKRDQRLWIGDLRLQALANYATFRNFDLVKRCLYLFAGLPREDGMVSACVFEQPHPLRGHEYIVDYAALYAPTVLEYARASNDWKTAKELWPVVRRQIELLGQYVGADGLFAAPAGAWVFIDWSEALDRAAAMHGVYVFAMRQAQELAQTAGAEQDVREYGQRLAQMTKAAHAAYFDAARGVFVSGPARQVSWATQAWMILSGIASKTEGRAALQAAMQMPDAVKPGAPYLYHYVIEAMLQCDLKAEALALLQSYWGSMVDNGADTFWEVYDPAKPLLSPYGSVLVNSYCHAWSCTPTYLLRQGGLL